MMGNHLRGLTLLCLFCMAACSTVSTQPPTVSIPEPPPIAPTAQDKHQQELELQRSIGTLIGTYASLMEQGNANFAALDRCAELRQLDPTWLGPLRTLWDARNQPAQQDLRRAFAERWAKHELNADMEQRMRTLQRDFQRQLARRYVIEARTQVSRVKSAQRAAQCQKVYSEVLNGDRDLQRHPVYRAWVSGIE